MIPYEKISSALPQNTQISNVLGSVILIDNNTKDNIIISFYPENERNFQILFTPFEKRYFTRFLTDNYDFRVESLERQKRSPLYHLTRQSNSVVIYETANNYQIQLFKFPFIFRNM